MSSTAERVKERLGITEVVSSYIAVEKAGVNFKARCPFHNEKTPSFMVSPVRGSFYCFGCGEKGDIFSFVEKMEGVDFYGALKLLAERAQIPITHEKTEDRSEKNEIYRILEIATQEYQGNFTRSLAATAYLKKRGLTSSTIENFRIGFALDEWRGMRAFLKKNGFSDVLIEKAGITKKVPGEKSKEPYDRFRNRVMFPISDASGRVVAFSGRFLPIEGSSSRIDTTRVEPAKYINSPETILYSKSSILYGYDKAKEGIRKWGFTILVEGQMDLLMSHQAGFRNTVALSGTALGESQINMLKRLSPKLVLALDNDRAGIRASGKSALLALSAGMDVKVAKLTDKDPAELIKDDPNNWKKSIREASHIVDFYLSILKESVSDIRQLRSAVRKEVIPFVASIGSAIDQAHFIERVASTINVSQDVVRAEIDAFNKSQSRPNEEIESAISDISDDTDKASAICGVLFGLLQAEVNLGEKKLDLKVIEKGMLEVLGATDFASEKERATLGSDSLFRGEEAYVRLENVSAETALLMLLLEQAVVRRNYSLAIEALKESEQRNDVSQIDILLKQCDELSKKLGSVQKRLSTNSQ